MYTIKGIKTHFGFRREGGGRVVYLFNGEVDYSATELLTDSLYTDENDDGEVDFSEYDPSVLDTEAAGELEDEVSMADLAEKLGSERPSVAEFFKKRNLRAKHTGYFCGSGTKINQGSQPGRH